MSNFDAFQIAFSIGLFVYIILRLVSVLTKK